MPPLEAFPKSHVVTFKYYCGVIAFLEEDYINVPTFQLSMHN
jgi:COP9 signalosome complex subunit 12